MIFNQEDQAFLEKLAPTRTGKQLLRVLENFETYHADIRNLGGVEASTRIDALALLRESFIDKLKTLGKDELEKPIQDEYR